MEKNERIIFQDIPRGGKKGKFHSAILTTFSLDLLNFDNHILNLLRSKEISSINIFTDYRQFNQSLEYTDPRFLRNIGKDYSVIPIETKGAFHPKINFFIGETSILVVFGTGNLTIQGQGKNHEVFTGFMVDEKDDSQLPLIKECWNYILKFVNNGGEYDKIRILKEIPENCDLLKESFNESCHELRTISEKLSVALLYNNSKSSILSQIRDLIPTDDVRKITIASPFFDENGDTLSRLAQLYNKAKLEIMIQERCILPPVGIEKTSQINFYDFNETIRGKKEFKDFQRLLHAKIIHFQTIDEEFCLIGSANPTIAGLGTLKNPGINEEFSVLYRSSKIDFLSKLGIKGKKKFQKSINSFVREERSSDKEESNKKYKIECVEYRYGVLTFKCADKLLASHRIKIENGEDQKTCPVYLKQDGIYTSELMIEKSYNICYLINEKDERISNKTIINRIESLSGTNPSRKNRKINEIISRIENKGYDGLEIADILSDIMIDHIDEKDFNIVLKSSGNNAEKHKNISLPEIKYQEKYDNNEIKISSSIVIDGTSRLIDCVETNFKNAIKRINETLIDEEEDAKAEVGAIRDNSEINEKEVIPHREYEIYEISDNLLDRFIKYLKKRKLQNIKLGNYSIIPDDINFFSIVLFVSMEICYLNRSNYKINIEDSLTKSIHLKKLYEGLNRSIISKGFGIIEEFVKFCKAVPNLKDISFEDKIKRRAIKYLLLYDILFFKKASGEEKRMKGKDILKSTSRLMNILDITINEQDLINELMPISLNYNNEFRENHIRDLLMKFRNL